MAVRLKYQIEIVMRTEVCRAMIKKIPSRDFSLNFFMGLEDITEKSNLKRQTSPYWSLAKRHHKRQT